MPSTDLHAVPQVFDPQEDAEWLPGELEYYQQLCAEIYKPKLSLCTKDERDVREVTQSGEAGKSDAGSQEDLDTTQDSEY